MHSDEDKILIDQYNNTKLNRDKFLGGSDFYVVINKDKSKKGYQRLIDNKVYNINDDIENTYTIYGNHMEEYIRNYINEIEETNYKPSVFFNEELKCRGNVDGYCKETNSLIEIKCKKDVDKAFKDKKIKAQMLFYMWLSNCDYIDLYVYDSDFIDKEFKPLLLSFKRYTMSDLLEVFDISIENIEQAIQEFWNDIELNKELGDIFGEGVLDD